MHRTRTIATALALLATTATVGTALASSGGTAPTDAPPAPATSVAPRPIEVPTTLAEIPAPAAAAPTTEAPTTSVPTEPAAGDEAPTSPTPPPAPTAPAEPVHEIVPGGGSPPPPTGEPEVLGELGTSGLVPEGLDLVAPPAPTGAHLDLGGPTGFAAAPSCSHQCISRGVAYPRGFGAELVVETTVPTEMFISAIADVDGDGDYEESYFETTPIGVTEHRWALDGLTPGTTYHAMVAATDADGHTSHAWGEFTTLSQRDVVVELGDLEVWGGPSNVDATGWSVTLGGATLDGESGAADVLLLEDVPRLVDLVVVVTRGWDEEVCEAWLYSGEVPQGHHSPACVAWNTGSFDVDLDQVPAGATSWTSTTVQLDAHDTTGQGGALPPGYGDPYWFDFEVPVTLHVTYS